ncbi:MAG: flagellar hook-associated protein FlgL [Woeseiaceae bacterium]
MRISTSGAFQQGLSMMLQLQAALDRTQQQIASGRRILSPADDPIAAARSLKLRESVSRLTQFDRNATMATNRLSYEESALQSVNNVLQRVRELALQANNATQSNESRQLIAVEMRQHIDALVQLANQQDGNGRYLFSGNRDGIEPVVRTGASFAYNGDQGQRFVQIGENRQIADGDPGSAVFFQIRTGNGTFSIAADPANAGTGVAGPGSVLDPTQYDRDDYTVRFVDPQNYEVVDSGGTVISAGAFQSGDSIAFRGIAVSIDGQPAPNDTFLVQASRNRNVFDMVAGLADSVDLQVGDDVARADMTNRINAGILGIDQALGAVSDVRTQVGSRLSAIENQVDSNSAFALGLKETLAGIEDLDYAEALSMLSIQATMLEAAQKSFLKTRDLSLFNFL